MSTNEVIMDEPLASNVQDTIINNQLNKITSKMENNSEISINLNSSSTCEINKDVNSIAYLNNADTEMNKVNNDSETKFVHINESSVSKDELESNNQVSSQKIDQLVVVNNTNKIDAECIVKGNNTASEPKENNDKMSSLGAIALEYDSSDSDIECTSFDNNLTNKQTVPASNMQSYRSKINESSSDEESDSDDDSSSTSSSSSSSSSSKSIIEMSDDSDNEDTLNKNRKQNKSKSNKSNIIKSELDDLPPIEDLKISVAEVQCDILGEVAWMVEQLVVVSPKPNKPTLNLETVLFVDKGKRALGKIFDVFGQVNEPHYCVRFNSADHILQNDIKVGMTVYFCPNTEYTSLVFLHELVKMKGTDGGGEDEPPEFSDDEEERKYYEKLGQEQANKQNVSDVPSKKRRTKSPACGWQSNHPWNRNKQNFQNDRHYASRGNQQYGPPQNPWPFPYPYNWCPFPRYPVDPYGYVAYANDMQAMPYPNNSVNNSDPTLQDQHHNSGMIPPGPRFPHQTRPRFPPNIGPFGPYRPNMPPGNLRFKPPHTSLQPHQSFPVQTNTPRTSLPPPPPPPSTSGSI